MSVRLNTFSKSSIQLGVPPASTEDLKTALAVVMDGATTDSRKNDANWTGATDGANGIISLWFKRAGTGLQALYYDSSISFRLEFETDDKLSFLIRTSAAATVWQWETVDGWTDTDWHHLYIAWELDGTPVGDVYIDGVEYTVANSKLQGTFTEPQTGLAGWAAPTAIGIGNTHTAGIRFDGCLSEVYINDDEYLSASANLTAFRGALSGKPVNLGVDGSTPTGTAPLVYLQGASATWEVNSGTGGDLTLKFNVADCTTSPSD